MSDTNTQDGNQKFRPVRDRRERNWYWKDNALYTPVKLESGEIVTMAAIIGVSASAVYDLFCKLADKETQTCFPSVPYISWMCGLEDPTVTEATNILQDHGMVEKEHRISLEGDPTSNMYVLLPLSEWTYGGGKLNYLPPKTEEKQSRRREKLQKRKVPRAVKEKDHRGQLDSPPVGNSVSHRGQSKTPPYSTYPAVDDPAAKHQASEQQDAQSAPDAVVEKSNDLSEDAGAASSTNSELNKTVVSPTTMPGGAETQEASSSEQPPVHPSVQSPLPGAAAIDAALNDAPENARSLARRLLDCADAEGITWDVATVLRIVCKSELVKANKMGLRRRISEDYKKVGLSSPIWPHMQKKLLADEMKLRWRLFTWPAYMPGVAASYEKKNEPVDYSACFCNRWGDEEDTALIVSWFGAQVRQEVEVEQKAQLKISKQQADEFIASLTPAQKAEFDLQLRVKNPLKDQYGWLIPSGTEEYDRAWVRRVNDPEFRARILSVVEKRIEEQSSPAAPPAPFQAPEPQPDYKPHRNTQQRCLNLFIPRFLSRLKSGELTEEGIASACQSTDLGPKDALWLEEQILKLWAQEKAA